MLTLGIDDAGRGPLIGPMILAGVLLNSEQEKFLKKHNVRDSKVVEHPMRVKLSKIIKEGSEGFFVVKATPEEIDSAIISGKNLNTLEAMKMAEVINEINDGKFRKLEIKVIVDCPSVNIRAWQGTLMHYLKNIENLDLHCEHKADVNHPAVSAASILAKVAREEAVAKLKKEFGDIGSGYPSDPNTIKFLKKYGKKYENSGIFRKSWSTWKSLFSEPGQKTMNDF